MWHIWSSRKNYLKLVCVFLLSVDVVYVKEYKDRQVEKGKLREQQIYKSTSHSGRKAQFRRFHSSKTEES